MLAATRRRRIRHLGLAFAGLIAAVLAVETVVWVNIGLIQKAAREVAEAQGELTWADATLDAARDQQNALAGIVATHDPRYASPYEEGQRRFELAFQKLAAFAASDDRRREVASIRQLAKRWRLDVAAPRVAAAKAGRSLRPPSSAELDEMNQIQRDIDDLRHGESTLLARRDDMLAGAFDSTRLTIAVGSIAALAFVLVILGLAARQLINDRRRAEDTARTLCDALERAQSAERTKTRFLANMSHEMRTPLNGVTGMTEALAHTQLDPMQRELVAAIRFSSSTLDHLIGDLITVSREGVPTRIEREAETFGLGVAVRAIALPFGVEARAKGLEFAVEVDPAADLQVVGNPGALSELLSCLLSNAVKFTERGQVRVRLWRVDEEVFAVEVIDSGVGFDVARKIRMFETFNQEDDSETRRFGGAGLGLAVARRLAEELGGALDARSTPGEGSVFSFEIELPFAELDAALDVPPADAAGQARRVLIVDDNATNRKVLELILEQVGVDWVSVEDGRQAVEAARREAFTAILMDIQMPVMDGLTATREIRRLEREADRPAVPVIIVSANCQPEHLTAGRAAGAQRHLGKPVSAQALLEALDAVLDEAAEAA
jgi:signal transduction histidine kinase/ActR/RegA family two-component response regulator